MDAAQQEGKTRILVMDDDATLCEMLRFMLKALGYETVVTGEGAAAVAAYLEARESGRPFAAVILDLTVPEGMGGPGSRRQAAGDRPRREGDCLQRLFR